jgi:DNA-directed RNA polymerase subunit K/omega
MEFARPVEYLTQFERATIVATRAQQIACGYKILLTKDEVKVLNFQPLAIAEEELRQRKLTFVVERKTPQGNKNVIDVSQFRE